MPRRIPRRICPDCKGIYLSYRINCPHCKDTEKENREGIAQLVREMREERRNELSGN